MTSPIDTITSRQVNELFHDKYILILGDSVVRGLYKDLVKLINSDDLLNEDELRVKGETRFNGDRLLDGGVNKNLTNGIDYEEVREYSPGGRLRIRFYFLTKSYSSYMKHVVFHDIQNQAIKPDIVIMNSCLWDVSRYGVLAMKTYLKNVNTVMGCLRQMLSDALILWLSALPVSNSSKGGVIVPTAEYIRPILPGLIRDGNFYCNQICIPHNVLYIDVHTPSLNMLHLRKPDGIHWCAIGNRIMNEILLHHIQAFYHGVRDFKCVVLRRELGNKINGFKQQLKARRHGSKFDYFSREISDEDEEIESEMFHAEKTGKRKRSTSDDEKENERKRISNEQQRTVVVQDSMNSLTVLIRTLRHKTIDNEQFDPEYCDMMFDNEFEGLQLFHFSSFDHEILLSETNDDHRSICSLTHNPYEKSSTIPIPMATINEPDFIVLSSDDDEDDIQELSSIVLPVYLLNHLQ